MDRSDRLPYYNYASTNLYFVTICTHQRQKIFGDISNGVMVLSEIGKCVERAWKKMNEVGRMRRPMRSF